MNQLPPVFLLIVFCLFLACRTDPASTKESRQQDRFQSIQAEYNRLQGLLPDLEKVQFPYINDIADGQLTAWQEREDWVKIRKQLADGHGISIEEYYFEDGKLFFYFVHSQYSLIHPEADIHVTEERLYLGEDSVIRKLRKTHSFSHNEQVDMSRIANEEAGIEQPHAKYKILRKETEQLLTKVKAHVNRE